MKYTLSRLALPVLAFVPFVASAQTGDLFSLANLILRLINQVFIPLLFAIAFLVFLFGVYKYFILGGADSKSHEDGRKFILYGLVGFAIMVSVWGLVNIVTGTFGLEGTRPNIPVL